MDSKITLSGGGDSDYTDWDSDTAGEQENDGMDHGDSANDSADGDEGDEDG